MMQRFAVSVGIALLVAAAVWKLGISPRFEQRFPDGWRWDVNSVGYTEGVGEDGAYRPGTTLIDSPINIIGRTVTANSTDALTGLVHISDNYVVRDPATNAVIWEYAFAADVDPITGMYPGDYVGDYFLFPRNVQKTTHNIRNGTYQGVAVAFQREEVIAGISTYVFQYQGDMDDSAGYPDVPLSAGQAILCPGFELTYWVEPTTGEVLKFREWCEGDYVVDTATGDQLYGLRRWGAETTGDDLIRQAGNIQNQLTTYQWMTLYLPLLLLALGLGALAVGGYQTLRARQASTAS